MSLARLDASACILSGEYYDALELLKNENRQECEILSMLGQAYFNIGRFEQAYETYQKLYYDKDVYTYRMCGKTPEEFDSFGKIVFEVLEQSGGKSIMNRLPKYMDFEYEQSIEASDEQYEESREYISLLERCNKSSSVSSDKDYMLQHTLDEMYKSKDAKIVAKSCFFKGEGFCLCDDYENAFHCYMDAAIIGASKALYYGYAGNMLMKMTQRGENLLLRVVASILTYRAIDLDFNNARWHLNESMILVSLGILFSANRQMNMNFIRSAVHEISIAKQVLRPDQWQLKQSVEHWIQKLEKLK